MPTRIQAKATSNNGATVSAVGNLTGSPVQNNVLIATVVLAGSASFGITPPSGWAAVDGPSPLNPGGAATGGLYWKKAGASEPSSWTWTATGGTPSANSVTVSEWTGALNTSAPEKVAANFSASPFNTPTMTPAVDGCAILQCLASTAGLTSATTGFGFPAGVTADDSGGTNSGGLGTVVGSGHGHDTANQTTATLTTARSCTSTGITPNGGIAWTVALHPAPAVGLGTATLRATAHEFNAPYVHPVQAQSHIDSGGVTTSIIGTLDASPVTNNKLLAFISTSGNSAITLTPPSGWTLRDRTVQPSGNGIAFLYEKTAGTSEPATWTWTASAAPSDYVVSVVEVTGASTTAAAFAVGTQTSLTQATTPVLTTTVDGSGIIQGVSANAFVNPGPSISSYPGGIVQDTAGSTSNASFAFNSTQAITHDAVDQSAAGPTVPRTYQYGAIASSVMYTVGVAPDVLVLRTATAKVTAHGFRPNLKKWVAARDRFKAGTGTPVIVCLGDSITEGFYAGTNARDVDMWVTRLGKAIADVAASPARPSRYMPADVGPHDISNTHGVWPEYSTVSTPGTTSPWTSSGSAAIGNNTFGLGARCLRCTGAQTLSIAGGAGGCPSWATHATLCYSADSAGATFTVRSNGVVVDTFTTTGAVTAGVREVPITGGTAYAVDMPAGSYLEGVKWRDKAHGTSWLECLDSGHGGYQAANYDNSGVLQWAASIAAHNPVLVLVELGGNDIQAGRTNTQFQTSLTNVIAEVDAACVANGNSNGIPDYLIVAIPFQGDGTTITVAQWNAYLTAMQNVANNLGSDRAAFLDTQAAGILPASNGIPDQYRDDGIHPNLVGAAAYSKGFADFLMSIAEGTIGTAFGAAPATATAYPLTIMTGSGTTLTAAAASATAHPVTLVGFQPSPPIPPPPPINRCTLDGLSVNTLTWTPPADVSAFGHYEIQRLDTVTNTWQTFRTEPNPGTTLFVDPTPRIGVSECYRMRVVNTSGLASVWTTIECGTAPVSGCGYQFSHPDIPVLESIAYTDVYTSGTVGNRKYTFDEGTDVSERRFFQRNNVVAFAPSEHQGPRFQRDLLVTLNLETDGMLPSAPMIDLCRQPVPYLCVRDEIGNRWYANVRVLSETHQTTPAADEAIIQVEVVQVADAPSISIGAAP